MGSVGNLFEKLFALNDILRGPDGCMWDREQTVESLKPCLKSESKEVLDAIDSGDRENLKEELGDLLYNIIFISRLCEDEGSFTIADVLENQFNKMVSRHPHVFAGQKADTSKEAKEIYVKSKNQKG
jgi:uncharacterized protein YabN with tetrapyrrole methylase and pyrophosphatase domain